MANIPFLHPRRLADGTTAWNWKPSKRLRALGWANRRLGTGPGPSSPRREPIAPDAVIQAANALNRQLEEWQRAGSAQVAAGASAPRRYTFQDLVDTYRLSDAYRTEIAQRTRDEYDMRLRQLAFWAQDGALPIRAIDQAMVRELRAALLPSSKFKCASTLRVLRLLMRWAVSEHLLPADPTAGVPIPTPPSRAHKLTWRDTLAIAEHPDTHPVARRYLLLSFWMMQRRADMVALNRFAWQELHGADPRDLPALVNARGEVWGFKIAAQQKTGRAVVCPLPPFLHGEVEAAFEHSQWLFAHPTDPSLPLSGDLIRRRVKPAIEAAGFPDHQLRDARRSGASGLVDMGADRSDVFTITGHALLGNQRTMADVYMPADVRSACRAIAAAERTRRQLEAREQEEAQ